MSACVSSWKVVQTELDPSSYGRLKLLALCPDAREAFFKGSMDASTALLIARIPTQKLQSQALKTITEGSGMSFRSARDYVQREFMLDLAAAPFEIKDAKLLDKAGACTACTKRTGNQPELFDDVTSKDVCTDTACFASKKAAHFEATLKAGEANGDEVIRGEAAKEMLGSKWNVNFMLGNAGLVRLTDEIPDDEEERTWGDMLNAHKLLNPAKGKPALCKTIIENPFEEGLIVAVGEEAAMQALTDAGFKIKEAEPTEEDKKREKERGERLKASQQESARLDAEIEQTNAVRRALFNALRAKISADMSAPRPHVADGLYRILASVVFNKVVDDYNDAEEIIKLYMPDATPDEDADIGEEFLKFLPSLTTQQQFLLIMDCLMVGELTVGRYSMESSPESMLAIAQEIGIDADAIEQEVLAQLKPTKKTAKKGVAA